MITDAKKQFQENELSANLELVEGLRSIAEKSIKIAG
jgi:hypothetical protein